MTLATLYPVDTSGVGHAVGGIAYPQGKDTYFCEIGNVDGSSSRAWLCFPLTDIPANAIVTSASLCFWPYDTGESKATCSLLIRAADAADPSVPATYSAALGLSVLPQAVAWMPAAWTDVEVSSADVSDVIQAVINRSGYAAGDNALIVIDDSGSSNDAYRALYSAAYNDSRRPYLDLEWVVGPSSISGDGGVEQARAVVSGVIGGSEGAVGAVTQNSGDVLGYGGGSGDVVQARAEVAGTITTQTTLYGAIIQKQAEVAGLGGAIGELVAARAVVSGFISSAAVGGVVANPGVVNGTGFSAINGAGGVVAKPALVAGLIGLGNLCAGAVVQKRGSVSGLGVVSIAGAGAVTQKLARVDGLAVLHPIGVGSVVARSASIAGLIVIDVVAQPMVFTGALR